MMPLVWGDPRIRECLENAPPLFAQLEDDIERYHANFHGQIQSSANFLRQVHESDFCGWSGQVEIRVAQKPPKKRSKEREVKSEERSTQPISKSSASQDNHWKAHLMEIIFPY